MPISSPGIGSGLDVNGIVDQLVALERRPIALLADAKTKLTTKLSSFGLMQSYMANLQSISGVLAKADSWQRTTATSSNPAAVAATASPTAAAARYSIEVSTLAKAQTLASTAMNDPAGPGTGTLQITRAGQTVDVVIDGSDTTLQAVRDKINAAEAGVSASIVQDASGPRLVLTSSETGVANAATVAVAGGSGWLAGLTYPGGMTQPQPAANAVYSINNIPLQSASNRLSDVIDGVNLTLSQVTTGPVDVTVASDTAGLKKNITDFVAAYNELNKFLAAQTKFDEGSSTAGALQGDRTAVGLLNRLRTQVQQASPASAVYGRLSDMGLSLQRDGSLKIDDQKLDAALARPAELSKAFSTTGNGLALGFKALADGMLGTDGALTTRSEGLRSSIKRNEKDQERIEDRIARTRERLLRQYSALDNTVNQLTGLNSLVTQQLDALKNSFNYNNNN